MITDEFYEQLIEKDYKAKIMIIYTVCIIAAVVLSGVGMMFFGPGILPILIIAFALFYFFVLKMLKIEYEYSMLNSELQVDAIYNKEKRKHLFTVDVRKAEIIAPYGDNSLQSLKKEKVIDVSSGNKNGRLYSVIAPVNNKMTEIILEPDNKIEKQLKNWSGSHFIK